MEKVMEKVHRLRLTGWEIHMMHTLLVQEYRHTRRNLHYNKQSGSVEDWEIESQVKKRRLLKKLAKALGDRKWFKR